MASTRVIVGTVVTAAVLALGVACSSSSSGDGSSGSSGSANGTSGSGTGTSGSSTGTSGGGGSSGFKNCSGTNTSSTCTEAELKPYGDCVNEKCATKYAECYGADYKSGNFGGPCGTYIKCTQACGCNDTACYQKCGTPDAACTTCIQGSATCADSCTVPSCGSGSSGSSGGGGGGKTCADLKACCDKITDASKKSNCDQTYNAVKGSDANCGALYSTFAADCP